ncbi:MAG: MBOAT family protein [Gemmatimonadales bacterium]|nr:MBOAT family protein [Gemmatimonadales bacterium]
MLFNSLTFVVFFAVVLALHALPLPWAVKKTNLLLASYLFYAAWNPPFIVLLWISTVLDWYVARWIYAEERPARRRLLLFLSLAGNLGILGYFKYGGFLLENWQEVMAMAGIAYAPPDWSIVLPVGISFYTFQTMAYTLDVYLRRERPASSFLDFALFVTFFPQLVAGPIVRPADLIPQFATPRRATAGQFIWGLGLASLGLFQKVVVADTLLAPSADTVFRAAQGLHPLDAWIGVLAFSGQIFSDFAGYSTTAIGVALCLGFSLPDNFRFPYAAIGFSDFWRRWHISLSTWLRDYLYVPLGGNRKGRGRTYFNLMATMLLGGLWHGASWTFVVWGGLHGLYLAVERYVAGRFGGRPTATRPWSRVALALLTYVLVNLTWVFFRARDFPSAWRMIRSMLGVAPEAQRVLYWNGIIAVTVVTAVMLLVHWRMRETTLAAVVERTPAWVIGAIWAAMVFGVITTQGSGNAFIYFQF